MSSRPSTPVILALGAVMCLIWGSTWMVISGGLDHLPPFTSAAIRFWIAGGLMAAVVAWFGGSEKGNSPSTALWMASGALNMALSYCIVYWCETKLPSGLSAVLWASAPMMTAIATRLFLKGAPLSTRQWLGFSIGFAGIVALFWTDVRAVGPEAWKAGLLFLVSPLAATAGATLIKKYGQDVRSMELNRNSMLFGAFIISIVAGITERNATFHWTPIAVASILYLAAIGTTLGFGIYFWLLRTVEAHKLSLVSYITPVIALALGVTLRHEPVYWTTAFGSGLVVLGVALVASQRSPQKT